MPVSLAASCLLLLTGLAWGQSPYAALPSVPVPVHPVAPIAPPPRIIQGPVRGPAVAVPRVPTVQVPSAVQPVRYQASEDRPGGDGSEYQIQLVPPGLERLARLDSEEKLRERIRQETLQRDPKERVLFPDEPILSRDTYQGRGNLWSRRAMTVEPNFVCHWRLLFEQRNMERAGWDLGILSPVLGTGKFLADLALVPYHLGTRPCDLTECSAGLCLPGDPTPLLLYPEEVSLTGTALEAGVIAALIVAFP